MQRRVYIETSVVSYLTARPSNNVIKSACQQITRAWWDSGRIAVSSYISPYVIEEASAGDPAAAAERVEALRTILVLPIADEIPHLAEFLLLGGGLPAKARIDALHIACAAFHEIDVLLTWNCTHIANPAQLPVMRGLCAAKGYKLPELVTPFELMEVLP
jgi:predicted nucleic acid-binding protein